MKFANKYDAKQFYINGAWVAPLKGVSSFDIVNPATEAKIGELSLGSAQDADAAVKAARGLLRIMPQCRLRIV